MITDILILAVFAAGYLVGDYRATKATEKRWSDAVKRAGHK